MAFNLHVEAEKKFNKDAYELVNLIEESEIKEEAKAEDLVGSSAEKISLDWTDRLSDRPMRISHTTDGQKVDIYELYQGIQRGFNENGYPSFKRFVDGLYKIKPISNKITYDFLYNCAFAWMIETFKNRKSEMDFTLYLRERVLEVTGEYKYYFKILNLDIEKNFQLGQVAFEFLNRSFFERLNGKRTDEEINALREKFQGSVYAACVLKDVQKDRGREIAFEECCKAMNVLKLFSVTVRLPNHRTTYDIDKRVTVSEEHECIVENLKVEDIFEISLSAGSIPYQLDSNKIDAIILSSKNFVSLINNREPNELQRVLLNALEKYSEAISNKDIHRRIVDLFTIWESLLLKNDSVNIQDSLIFYGSLFLNVQPADKEFFASLIMSMYDVRSQMVHHANRKVLDFEKVTLLQRNTINLMETFIRQTPRLSTKHQLLAEGEQFLKMTVEEYTENRKKGV